MMSSVATSFRALYPFDSHYLSLGPHGMHYVDEGAGPPVVMLHGNPTWSFFYRGLIAALREDHRCVAPDHIGCGLSDKPGDDEYEYTLQRRVEDVEALLDHLGLHENVTLVLHDWGGMIGMAVALRRPRRVARFVILNTAAFLLPGGKRLPWRLRLLRRGPLGPLIVRGLNGFARGAARMAVARPMPPEVRAGYLAPYDSWRNRIATLRFVQDIPLRPGDRSYDMARWVDERMHTLADRPALICWGMRDFVFDAAFLAEWCRRWPRAEVREFPEAGHYLLEDAGAATIGLAAEFLQHTAAKP